jgi:carbohydrate kinase (thermoresistant glucokinase family)
LNGSKSVNILTSQFDRGGSDELASSSAVDNANQKRTQHRGGGKRRRESRSADGACADGGLGQRQVDGRARIASRARLALSGGRRPPSCVERRENRAGHPLDDADRLPWLRAVAGWIDERLAAHEPGIITCSNLKRAYRQITIGSRPGVRLVFLKGDEHVIHERIAQRQHRYMPPTLLRSQFGTLEEPGEDEHPLVVRVHGSIAETVIELLQRLAA